ncbi:helix-turn-helix domain-containing protein [Lysobacter enzymogenes]|uniref:helix-turn-helix domain-containing protein n=1 Tax=Lysobacter enzymogenes TaxID=69 RepID=UPI001AF20A33|nr:helix-turn-helix domain-containing protein [Lysobacter enzymogenes]QQP99561.1 helix-turn-helix domain-containing protein [Lysobacter enzymogenes]
MKKLMYSVDEALTLLSISRSRFYKAIGSGDLPLVKLGRRRMLTPKGLAAYIARATRKGGA